jgi:hypothetical protein
MIPFHRVRLRSSRGCDTRTCHMHDQLHVVLPSPLIDLCCQSPASSLECWTEPNFHGLTYHDLPTAYDCIKLLPLQRFRSAIPSRALRYPLGVRLLGPFCHLLY